MTTEHMNFPKAPWPVLRELALILTYFTNMYGSFLYCLLFARPSKMARESLREPGNPTEATTHFK
jgi:hypothetical protein